jgi:broad specificity phosphatase PhoE
MMPANWQNGLEGNIAIFSHGHFGRALAARCIGLPVKQAQHFLLSTASFSILGYEHNLAGAGHCLVERCLERIFDLMPHHPLAEKQRLSGWSPFCSTV